MIKKNSNNSIWLIGGIIGFILPLVLFGIFLSLKCFKIEFGKHLLSFILLVTLSFMELPAVVIGRGLGLPIETGAPASFLYSFTPLGYILTIIIWVLIGALIGSCLDRITNRRRGIVVHDKNL